MTEMFPTYAFLIWFIACVVIGKECRQNCMICLECEICGEMFADSCNDYFYGDAVNITCQLTGNDTAINSRNIYFTSSATGKNLSNEVTVIDDKTAVIQPTLTPEYNKKILYCRYNEAYVGQIQFKYLDYFPQNVTNFTCEWLGLEKLSCKWEHPVKYEMSANINVTFEWGTADNYRSCSDVVDLTRCDNIPVMYLWPNTHFRINVTNTIKKVTITTKKVVSDPRCEFSKPFQMQYLSVLEVNRTEMKIGWVSKLGVCQFTVKYKSKYSQMIYTYKDGSGDLEEVTDGLIMNLSVVLRNLSTYTLYDLEVTAKYCNLSSPKDPCVIHSDPATLTKRTSQDVARYPPKTSRGGYTQEVLRSTGVKNVTVYWKFKEGMEDFGPIVEYNATLVDQDGMTLATAKVSGTQQSYTFLNVPVTTRGQAYISAGTIVGHSNYSSPIVISEGNLKPPTMLLEKVNEDKQTYNVSWIPQNDTETTGFTVYWCDKRNGCHAEINWINVPPTKSSYIVSGLNEEYMFAVSMETQHTSSGFSWESCYYIRDKSPSAPDSIQIQSRDQSSITVVWSRPKCGELSPFIKLYNLSWCLVEDDYSCMKGKIFSDLVYSEINSIYLTYKIPDLEAATKYLIWATAVNSADQTSLEGVRYNVSTTEIPKNDESNTELLAAVITFLVLLLMGVIILCCLNYKYGLYRKVKECLYPEVDIIKIEITRPSPTNATPEPRGIDNVAVEIEGNNNSSRIYSNSSNGYKELGHIKTNDQIDDKDEQAVKTEVYTDAELSKSFDSTEGIEVELELMPSQVIQPENDGHQSGLQVDEIPPETTDIKSIETNSQNLNDDYVTEKQVSQQELVTPVTTSEYVLHPRESYSSSGIGTFSSTQRTYSIEMEARVFGKSLSNLFQQNEGYNEQTTISITENTLDKSEKSQGNDRKIQEQQNNPKNHASHSEQKKKLPSDYIDIPITMSKLPMKEQSNNNDYIKHSEDLDVKNDNTLEDMEKSSSSSLPNGILLKNFPLNNSLLVKGESSNSCCVQSYCLLPLSDTS